MRQRIHPKLNLCEMVRTVKVMGAATLPSFFMTSALPVDLSLIPPLAHAGFSQSLRERGGGVVEGGSKRKRRIWG